MFKIGELIKPKSDTLVLRKDDISICLFFNNNYIPVVIGTFWVEWNLLGVANRNTVDAHTWLASKFESVKVK